MPKKHESMGHNQGFEFLIDEGIRDFGYLIIWRGNREKKFKAEVKLPIFNKIYDEL